MSKVLTEREIDGIRALEDPAIIALCTSHERLRFLLCLLWRAKHGKRYLWEDAAAEIAQIAADYSSE